MYSDSQLVLVNIPHGEGPRYSCTCTGLSWHIAATVFNSAHSNVKEWGLHRSLYPDSVNECPCIFFMLLVPNIQTLALVHGCGSNGGVVWHSVFFARTLHGLAYSVEK